MTLCAHTHTHTTIWVCFPSWYIFTNCQHGNPFVNCTTFHRYMRGNFFPFFVSFRSFFYFHRYRFAHAHMYRKLICKIGSQRLLNRNSQWNKWNNNKKKNQYSNFSYKEKFIYTNAVPSLTHPCQYAYAFEMANICV